jgi:predicted dehydrogenase
MKQVVRKGFSSIIVDEMPDPLVSPHHVVVRPLHSLISSGTETASIHKDGVVKEAVENPSHLRKVWDVAMANGPLRTLREVRGKFGDFAVLGYSGAGVIVEKHPTVDDLSIGDRVAYGGEGTGHGEAILTGRRLVARVPDEVSLEQATFTTLGSIALNAVRTAGLGLGDTVAIIGLGLVGQLVAQLARLQGARVLAVDLLADRVELARRLGADVGLAGVSDLEAAVRAHTDGIGADCVIVAAAAKSAAPAQQGLRIVRDRGRLVVVGAVELALPWHEAYMKEVSVLMARAYGPGSYDPAYERENQDYPLPYVRWTENRNMEEFLRLLATGRVRVDELVTHRFPLEEAPAAYDTIMDPATASLAVVLNYPAAEQPDPVAAYRPTRRVALPSVAPARDGELRLALVGAGNIARWAHLPGLQRTPGARLHAVFSASGARGKSYATRYGAAYCTSDYDELLNDASVDAVIVASRNPSHASQALRALRAGKHVFVEKPMALTEEECAALARAARESGKQLMVGFNRRFAPFYREQRAVLSRRAGPAVLNCRVNSPGIAGEYWMADPAIGGAILGEACHFTDLFAWLLDSEPVSVSAFSLPTDRPDPVGQNNVAASFAFEDGSVATLAYCTVGSKSSGGERVEAFAPGIGVATEDFKRLVVQAATRRRRSKMFGEKGYDAQMAAFVHAIRTGEPPSASIAEGTRSTVMCLRLLDAARTREVQPVRWQHLLD